VRDDLPPVQEDADQALSLVQGGMRLRLGLEYGNLK